MIDIKDYQLSKLLNLLGEKVIITAPELKGEIERIIIERQSNVLFQVKYWIDGVVDYHNASGSEIQLANKKRFGDGL